MNDGIENSYKLVSALDKFEFRKPKRMEQDMKNQASPSACETVVEEAPKLELKALPSH